MENPVISCSAPKGSGRFFEIPLQWIKKQIGGQDMEYGYARISSRQQNERRQLAALQNLGIQKDKAYTDKQQL